MRVGMAGHRTGGNKGDSMFQLSVVSIAVNDQDKARRFYEEVLGFKTRGEGDRGTQFAWILMSPPSGTAGVTLISPNARQQPGQAQGMMLKTLDIERLHDRLKEKGLEITDIGQASWGRFATFSDPDGNGWVIAEPSLDI